MKHHPDDHNGLIDWALYGPKDPEIGQLVYQLAYGRNLRLVEIEDLIKDVLRRRLTESSKSQD